MTTTPQVLYLDNTTFRQNEVDDSRDSLAALSDTELYCSTVAIVPRDSDLLALSLNRSTTCKKCSLPGNIRVSLLRSDEVPHHCPKTSCLSGTDRVTYCDKCIYVNCKSDVVLPREIVDVGRPGSISQSNSRLTTIMFFDNRPILALLLAACSVGAQKRFFRTVSPFRFLKLVWFCCHASCQPVLS